MADLIFYHASVQLVVGEHTVRMYRVTKKKQTRVEIHIEKDPTDETVFVWSGHPIEAAVLADVMKCCLEESPFDVWFGETRLKVTVEYEPFCVMIVAPEVTLRFDQSHQEVFTTALKALAAIGDQ